MNTYKVKRLLRTINSISHERFVLHGSLKRCTTLIPHRPKLETFKNTRKAKPLRRKVVYATRVTDIAVLYATMPNDTQWYYEKAQKCMRVLHTDPELMLYAGFIHVCSGRNFSKGARIVSSKHSAKVVRTFKITPEVFVYLWDKKIIRIFSHL
jgi:hypothetical protein